MALSDMPPDDLLISLRKALHVPFKFLNEVGGGGAESFKGTARDPRSWRVEAEPDAAEGCTGHP